MPALSKKQQKFMGIVRSIQKGEQPASKFNKDAQDVAKDMKKTDVKKFASTKHKGLPMKKEILGKLKEMIKQELSEYTYGSGDIVKDVNPTCPHYGAEGKVKSVNPKSVVFVVMNKGKNFKPGMELEKSHDQMKKIGESINEMSAKSKKIISKLGKKEKEMFSTMVDMLGFDQVMSDYKRDKKAFKQALKDMSESVITEKMSVKSSKDYIDNLTQAIDLIVRQANNLKGALAKHPIKRDANKLKAVKTMLKRSILPAMLRYEKENSVEKGYNGVDLTILKKKLQDGQFKYAIQYSLLPALDTRSYDSNSFYALNNTKEDKLRERLVKVLRGLVNKMDDAQLENINEDGHTDVASSKRKVMIMVDDSNKLLNKLNGMNKEDSLPSWWTDKITLSQNYLEKATNYITNPVESINENRDFEKLYNLFTKKDYFNLKNSIKQMLRNYDVALKKGDKGAQKYTKQDVIKSVTAQNKENAKRVYDELVTAIKKKDIRRLKSRLRYDQPYSLAIFNQITGKKLPKTNSGILSFLDNEFMKESVNEMSAKTKKIISKLGKKEKEMFIDMVDMLGFDQVMADYKRDKKAFKQALKDMSESVIQERNDEVQTGNEYTKLWLQSINLIIKQANGLKGALAKHPIKRDINKLKAVEKLFRKFIKPAVEQEGKDNRHYAPNQTQLKKYLSDGKFKISTRILRQTIESSNGYDENSFYYLGDKEKQLTKKMGRVLYDIENKMDKANLENVNESMNPSAVKKMRDEFEKTGELPPHLKKFAKDLNAMKKKHKVKNIVVPGLEWMSDMKENINEDGHTDVASSKRKVMIMVDDSNKLLNKLNGMNKEDSLPSWWSDKITLSQNYLEKATNYLLNPVESVNEFRDKREANTALDQIGPKALYMIGAKDYVFGNSGGKKSLVFKIMRNSKGVSHIRMRLSSMDLYDMEFLAIRAGKVKVKSKEKGVYGDQLGVMIKKNTGLNIRL